MQAFRTLAFTIYTIPGQELQPTFLKGDRVMVNRWSYGLRTGREGLFAYGRILRQPPRRNDLVAVDDTSGQVIICRCAAMPGDSGTIKDTKTAETVRTIVPGIDNCTHQNYYWMRVLTLQATKGRTGGLRLIPENQIIGRVCLIVYNHADSLPFWQGYRNDRWLIKP